jgi:hypothetical protein
MVHGCRDKFGNVVPLSRLTAFATLPRRGGRVPGGQSGGFPGEAPGYDYAGELAALTAPESREALRASGRGEGPGRTPRPDLTGNPRIRRSGLPTPATPPGSPERVAGCLRHLPAGLTELYAHPATSGGFPGEAPKSENPPLRAPDARNASRLSGAVRAASSPA